MIGENKLRATAYFTFCIFLITQIVLVYIYWDSDSGVDANRYAVNAIINYWHGYFYPSTLNLYDEYLHSPGMVNYLILQYVAMGGANWYGITRILNILMSAGIVLEMAWLSKRFFSVNTAYWAVILHCVILTNVFAPICVMTEVPFLFFALSAFCLVLRKGWFTLFFAGLIYAIAHTFRPLAFVFIITSLWLLVLSKQYLRGNLLLSVTVFFIVGYGFYNYKQTGIFVTSSTTGGYNLIMTTGNKYIAKQDFTIFDDPANIAYINGKNKLTYHEKDSIWRSRSLNWIAAHPFIYTSQYVGNLFLLWGADYWSVPEFGEWDNYEKIIRKPNPKKCLLIRRGFQFSESILYYIVLVMAFSTFYYKRQDLLTTKSAFILLPLLGSAFTAFFPVIVRFHYPYLFALTLWAAYGLSSYCEYSKIRFTKEAC